MISKRIKPSLYLGSFSLGDKTSPLLLAAITLLGFGLRLVRLDFQPLWWDEGWSLFFATRDFSTMLERTAVDIHPPLYYALLTAWMQAAGKGEVAVRLLSVVVGTVTIPLLYLLGKRLFGSRVGLLSALLIAIAPFHIYYSQEVRMYGLVTFFSLASVYLFVELLASSSTRRTRWLWALYIAATAAALYTQYYAAFVVAFEIVVVVITTRIPTLRHRKERSVKERTESGYPLTAWLFAWLAVAVLYLPWVLYAGQKLYAYVNMKVVKDADKALDPFTYLVQHLVAFSVGHVSAWTFIAPMGVLAVLLMLLGAFKRSESAAEGPVAPRLVALLYLVVPIILGYLVNLVYPFFPAHGERLLLPAAPAFYLLVSLGILVIWERRWFVGWVTLALIAGICAASLYDFYTVPRYPNGDYRPLITNIQRQAQPGDLYLAEHPWQIGYLEAYYSGAPLSIFETPSVEWIRDPNQLNRELGALLAERRRVWLPAFQELGAVAENAMDGYLRPRTYTVLDAWYGTTRLELFASAPEPTNASLPIELTQNLTLDSFAVSTEPIAAGQDILPIRMNWSDPVPIGYSISLRLVDAQGYVWAQDDRGIEKGEQRIGFAVPLGTPPGAYSLSLIPYKESNKSQDAVVLAKINVTRPRDLNLAVLPHRLSVQVGDSVRLVGYDAPDAALQPGVPTTITFYWQAQQRVNVDYDLMMEVVDDKGNVFAHSESAPARGIYPMTQWQMGEIVRDPQSLMLQGNTPDGDLNLVLKLVDPQSQPGATENIGRVIKVKGRPHVFSAPAPSVKSDVRFGDFARLAGYDMDQTNGNLHLVLYWQSMAPINLSYKVFAHALDGSGNLIGQVDQVPGAQAFPTTSWVKGEYLVDEYNIPVSSTQPAQMTIGMYDPTTGARLPAFDASNQPLGDHIVLPTRNN